MIKHHTRVHWSILLSLGLLLPASISEAGWREPAEGSASENASIELDAQEKHRILKWGREHGTTCGINALYFYLRMHGIDTSVASIEEAVGLHQRGHSLLELVQCATTSGLDSEVVRLESVEALKTSHLPVVVYGTQMSRRLGRTLGHYLVVLSVDESGVHYMDSTSGRRFSTTAGDFMLKTTGHAIRPRPDLTLMQAPWPLVGSTLLLLLGLLWWRHGTR